VLAPINGEPPFRGKVLFFVVAREFEDGARARP
jgi:hypothetical protein